MGMILFAHIKIMLFSCSSNNQTSIITLDKKKQCTQITKSPTSYHIHVLRDPSIGKEWSILDHSFLRDIIFDQLDDWLRTEPKRIDPTIFLNFFSFLWFFGNDLHFWNVSSPRQCFRTSSSSTPNVGYCPKMELV